MKTPLLDLTQKEAFANEWVGIATQMYSYGFGR